LKARGYVCGRHRVARIMRENGLQAKMARRFKYHRHRDWLFAKTPNLLLDQPHASAPNQVWVGDVSYIRVRNTRARSTGPHSNPPGCVSA
jgi:putative transposase